MIVRHSTSRLAALGTFSGAGERSLFDKYENAEMRGFGTFGALNTAAEAYAVAAKVRLAYGAGAALLKFVPLDWQDLIAKTNVITTIFQPDALISPSKGALLKAYKDLGTLIDDWAGRKFRWARDGKRDDGTPYSWKQWADLGQTYLGSAAYYSKIAVADGFFASALQSLKEFAESLISGLARAVQPTEWPTWAKAAAGLAGLAAVAYIVRTPASLK